MKRIRFSIPVDMPFKDARRELLEAFERSYLKALLADEPSTLTEASRRCALSRRRLRTLLRRHELAQTPRKL